MEMHEFSIIASGLAPRAEDFELRFYGAGRDDATIAFQKGCIIADIAGQCGHFQERAAHRRATQAAGERLCGGVGGRVMPIYRLGA
jgi:hypothetical protein